MSEVIHRQITCGFQLEGRERQAAFGRLRNWDAAEKIGWRKTLLI